MQIEELSDDDLPAFRSAGTLNTPSSSRARMLDQQREIELKKRQANMQNGGISYFLLSVALFFHSHLLK